MTSAAPEEQIDILEIYVKKSRAIGLGQRLLWHLDKFNKKLKLPWIPDVKDFYMQPINATYRLPEVALNQSKVASSGKVEGKSEGIS